jgi:hypothetical protein
MCRAWVNFNGTGTVAIRASGNVSSITDNGTGDYTVNFTTAMPDANYASTVNFGNTANSVLSKIIDATAPTASALRMAAYSSAAYASIDVAQMHIGIFR